MSSQCCQRVMMSSQSCIFSINSFKSCNFIFTSAPFSRRRGAELVLVFEDLNK